MFKLLDLYFDILIQTCYMKKKYSLLSSLSFPLLISLVTASIVGLFVYTVASFIEYTPKLLPKKITTVTPQQSGVTSISLPIASTTEEIVGKQLLGKAQLSYAGGTKERAKNIELGVARINGTIIESGKEFSFTKTLGEVSEATGFSLAKVFLNGEVTKGLGGGLCQVSTILFRSVLRAGLPVTERHNHSYTVSLYDVGFDATFSDPGLDLKFVNDTLNPITIFGTTTQQNALFEIYGTSDGRISSTTEPIITKIIDVPPPLSVATSSIILNPPKCINTPQIGYTAQVVYGIMYPTGIEKIQTFTSKYKPLQRICYFNPIVSEKK